MQSARVRVSELTWSGIRIMRAFAPAQVSYSRSMAEVQRRYRRDIAGGAGLLSP